MARKGENIYKRKDGRWEGRYKSGYNAQGQAKYKSVYGKTYSEVKSMLTKKKSDIIKGISSCVLTIREVSSSWINGISKKIKESTNAVYITKLEKYILPELGELKLMPYPLILSIRLQKKLFLQDYQISISRTLSAF